MSDHVSEFHTDGLTSCFRHVVRSVRNYLDLCTAMDDHGTLTQDKLKLTVK